MSALIPQSKAVKIISFTYAFCSLQLRLKKVCCFPNSFNPELIKDGVVKVDVSSIGTKFESFVQAGCRDLCSHHGQMSQINYFSYIQI